MGSRRDQWHRTRSVLSLNALYVCSLRTVPDIPHFPGLIDTEIPEAARTRTGFDGEAYNLVFSDEFNVDNRTFYPGDDPYWEAADLHYW